MFLIVDGETNVPDSLSNVVALAAGINYSLPLKRDEPWSARERGTVLGWGFNPQCAQVLEALSQKGSSGIFNVMNERISINPKICHGQACITGTRIPVHQIVRMFAHGDSMEKLLAAYPCITREDILACLNYAASLAEEQVTPLDEAGLSR